MSKRHKAREIALQGIYQYDIGDSDLADILKFDWVNKKNIPVEILLFAEELITGTLKQITLIDEVIKENLAHWEFDKISPIDRNILRFSVFSFIYQKEIPFIVVINEAIDIARKFGGVNSYRFINGVLDGIWKKIDSGKYVTEFNDTNTGS